MHDVLRPGDRVLLSGPYGSFTAAPVEPGPVLYLAGGSGLAPVRALAEATLRHRTGTSVVLFFSARTQRDLIDDERFRSWQRRHPGRFRYLRTLTRADGPPPAGRIPAILGDWFPDLSGWRVYIAGAPGFVTACAAAARARGARPALGAHRGVLHRAAAVGSRAARRSRGAAHDQEQDLHQDRG